MLALLPRQNATVFFADVSLLRRGGMLELLAGSKPNADAEYQKFVRQTGFDYSRDLDAIAGAASKEELFFVIRGRFDWARLREYATAHAGSCASAVCSVPTSRPGRWASFFALQPDTMALALSAASSAVNALRPERRQSLQKPLPRQPVWVQVSPSLLRDPTNLPLAVRFFAASLQPANSVLLSLTPAYVDSGAAFNLQLEAECPSEATADSLRSQLEIQTKILSRELQAEREKPSPADLTGLLTSGSFQVVGKRAVGTWPVRKELLKTLE